MDDFTYTPPAAGKASLKDRILGMDKKLLAIIGGAAALLLVVIILIAVFAGGGSKTSPLSLMEKYVNRENVRYEDYLNDYTGKLVGSKAVKIVKILRSNEDFAEYFENIEESFAGRYEDRCDEYGEDFKIRYKNDRDSEDEIDEDDLDDYKDMLKELGKSYVELSKELSKMKNSEKKDLAEELDISLRDLNKIIDCMKDIGTELKGAKVTEGYELNYDITITGSELDEPEEDNGTMNVYKINGKWCSGATYSALYTFYNVLCYFY